MLNISIVLYHPRWEEEVVPLVEELLRCRSLRKIYLIDNSEEKCTEVPISSGKLANSITVFAATNSGIEKRLLCRISSLFFLSSGEIAKTLTLIIFLSIFFFSSIFL